MKIRLKHEKNHCTFGDLMAGDIFQSGGEILMKTSCKEKEIYNAVGVECGRKLVCSDDEKVIPRPDMYLTNE